MVRRLVITVNPQFALILPVIRRDNDHGLVEHPLLLQRIENLADMVIHVLDARIIAIDPLPVVGQGRDLVGQSRPLIRVIWPIAPRLVRAMWPEPRVICRDLFLCDPVFINRRQGVAISGRDTASLHIAGTNILRPPAFRPVRPAASRQPAPSRPPGLHLLKPR